MEEVNGWRIHVYQHTQGGKRLQEAGWRPEQGEAEAEEEQSDATITPTHTLTHKCLGTSLCRDTTVSIIHCRGDDAVQELKHDYMLIFVLLMTLNLQSAPFKLIRF